MQGYSVVTSDDHKVGHVVGEHGDHLIVEQGTIFKSRHALPKAFAHANDAEECVRITVTKDILADSPKVTDDSFDEHAVALHYGLADTSADADPGESAEHQGIRAGIDPPEAKRAARREGEDPAADPPAVHDRSRNANDPGGVTANR